MVSADGPGVWATIFHLSDFAQGRKAKASRAGGKLLGCSLAGFEVRKIPCLSNTYSYDFAFSGNKLFYTLAASGGKPCTTNL